MQLAQDESPAQTNSQECTPLPLSVIIDRGRLRSGRLLLSLIRARELYLELALKHNRAIDSGSTFACLIVKILITELVVLIPLLKTGIC